MFDYMVCHFRGFILVCPHFLSFNKILKKKEKFDRECSLSTLDKLVLNIKFKIHDIQKKQIMLKQRDQTQEVEEIIGYSQNYLNLKNEKTNSRQIQI